MAGYTKADFYAAYRIAPVHPVTNRRYTKAPLHYHPAVMKPMCNRTAEYIIAAISITADDVIIIFGGAYGWTGEALMQLVPGCFCVSVDISDYVQQTKGLSPNDELLESILAAGYAIDDGAEGQAMWEAFQTTAPRATIEVIAEDMRTNGGRNKIRAKLPKDPTRIITEEVWQLLTDTERAEYADAAVKFGVPLSHVIDGVVIP